VTLARQGHRSVEPRRGLAKLVIMLHCICPLLTESGHRRLGSDRIGFRAFDLDQIQAVTHKLSFNGGLGFLRNGLLPVGQQGEQ
jgi:hypothetical protein